MLISNLRIKLRVLLKCSFLDEFILDNVLKLNFIQVDAIYTFENLTKITF